MSTTFENRPVKDDGLSFERRRVCPMNASYTVHRTDPWAAGAAAALLGVVVLFQWAVVLGAPWGELTQGEATIGPLSASGRWTAAASSLLLIAMALSILARAGAGPKRSLSPRATTVMTWLTGAFAALTVLLNLASPSAKERAVWAPVSTATLLLSSPRWSSPVGDQ